MNEIQVPALLALAEEALECSNYERPFRWSWKV